MNNVKIFIVKILYGIISYAYTINNRIINNYYRNKISCPRSVNFGRVSKLFSGNNSVVSIGKNSCIDGELLINNSAELSIGEKCYIGVDSRIWSNKSITIGNNVLISHNVNIHDSNSHSLCSSIRRHEFDKSLLNINNVNIEFDISCLPIIIENDVWIGFNATIFKGVRVGEGAIIAAGSIVTDSVAPYTIVAGIPAKEIGKSFR